MPTNCKHCGSTNLASRGGGLLRNECRPCLNRIQRENYAKNREKERARIAANYRKHSSKRRQEAKDYAQNNKERRALIEWFRKKGIKASELPEGDLDRLTEMKKALKASKEAINNTEK